jgi:hypothetical protein
VWDHGELTEKEAEARVKKAAGGTDGYFLISTRPKGFTGSKGATGEYWLSVAPWQHYPITIDPRTKMLLVPKNPKEPLTDVHSYDDAVSLPALVAALSKPRRSDWYSAQNDDYHLQHPVPSPESRIGAAIPTSLLDPLLELYTAARTKISGLLTRTILSDLEAYNMAAAKHIALAGPDVMARLAAAATPAASDAMRLSSAEIEAMTVDATAPPSTALMHITHSQRIAADVSIAVYDLICLMIDAANVGGYCLPGGVRCSVLDRIWPLEDDIGSHTLLA